MQRCSHGSLGFDQCQNVALPTVYANVHVDVDEVALPTRFFYCSDDCRTAEMNNFTSTCSSCLRVIFNERQVGLRTWRQSFIPPKIVGGSVKICYSCRAKSLAATGQSRDCFADPGRISWLLREPDTAPVLRAGYCLDPQFSDIAVSVRFTCELLRQHALSLIDSSAGAIRVIVVQQASLMGRVRLYVRRRFLVQVRAAASVFLGAYFSKQLPCHQSGLFCRDIVRIIVKLLYATVDDYQVWQNREKSSKKR